MSKLEWEQAIEKQHPVIRCWVKAKWPLIARLNGWLPLPPTSGNSPQGQQTNIHHGGSQ